MPRSALISLLALVLACPSATPGFGGPRLTIDSSIPAAVLAESYLGQLTLTGGEASSFTLGNGELPPGLTLREDGLISGIPTWLGSWLARVDASTGSGETLSADVTIVVEPGSVPVFPGFPRNPHIASSGNEYLGDLWVRVAGAGELGQTEVGFDPGLYLAGLNGVSEGGGGDDVRVGDLRLGDDASLGQGQWSPTNGEPAESPPEWDPDTATFTAGEQAGRKALSFGAQGFDSMPIFLGVVPPDWCPNGEHPRGGPSPGVCE